MQSTQRQTSPAADRAGSLDERVAQSGDVRWTSHLPEYVYQAATMLAALLLLWTFTA